MNLEGNPQSLLTFRVGPVLCCAPSLPVRSIITPPKLTHIAGSEPAQPGIFKHGSHIVKVFDLRLKFGVDASEQTHPGNLIVTISEAGNYAFWVDQILDVFDFPAEGWGNLPPAIPRGVFSRTLLLNNKIHLYTEFEKLANIRDLGYLKHYIQQLSEKKPDLPMPKDSHKAKMANSTSQVKVDETKQPAITTTDEKKSNEEIKSADILKSNEVIKSTDVIKSNDEIKAHEETKASSTTPSSVSRSSLTKTNEQSLSHTPVDKTPLTREKNITTATSSLSSLVNSPSHEKRRTTQTSEDIRSSAIAPSVFNKKHETTSSNTLDRHSQHQPVSYSKPENTLSKRNDVSALKNTTTFSSGSESSSQSSSEIEKDQSNFGIAIFFILLLLLPIGGIYYYLSEETASPYTYKKEKLSTSTDNPLNTKVPAINLAHKEPPLIQKEAALIPEPVIKDKSATTDFLDETDLIENSEYRADITQDENEITITIHQPAPADDSPVTKSVITPLSMVEDIKDETVIDTASVKSLPQDELDKTIAPAKIINEITHTVVKGDTLWAIAKKYVKDPFLYPELARLSNIKNPHRIYPGNRVRIRFTKN